MRPTVQIRPPRPLFGVAPRDVPELSWLDSLRSSNASSPLSRARQAILTRTSIRLRSDRVVRVSPKACHPGALQPLLSVERRDGFFGLNELDASEPGLDELQHTHHGCPTFGDPFEVVALSMHFDATDAHGALQAKENVRHGSVCGVLRCGHANSQPIRAALSPGPTDHPEPTFGIEEPSGPRSLDHVLPLSSCVRGRMRDEFGDEAIGATSHS